jgi:cyclopropane-fatty-acyl-phospholipid synthase
MQRAIETYDVNAIGLTLSECQREYAEAKLAKVAADVAPGRNVEVRLQGWEEFDEKVDRIVSIGAFEHFRFERYEEFFAMAHRVLPEDGSMLLHTITLIDQEELDRLGLPLTMRMARFTKFMVTEIFPGGRLPTVPMVEQHADKAGFNVVQKQAIGPHYVKTLQLWAQALEAQREQAIAAQSQEVYDRYMKYLTGCVYLFRDGYANVHQFTLQK